MHFASFISSDVQRDICSDLLVKHIIHLHVHSVRFLDACITEIVKKDVQNLLHICQLFCKDWFSLQDYDVPKFLFGVKKPLESWYDCLVQNISNENSLSKYVLFYEIKIKGILFWKCHMFVHYYMLTIYHLD